MDTQLPLDPMSESTRAMLRPLVDSATVLVWMTDVDDVLTFVSHGDPRLVDGPVPVPLSAWLEFIHPDDRAQVRAVARHARSDRKEYQVEYRVVKSDGTHRLMISSAAPRFAPGGAFAGYTGSLLDAGELRLREARFRHLTGQFNDEDPDTSKKLAQLAADGYHAQAELRRSNERLYAMLESMADAFFAVDRDWRITYVNRRTSDFIGRGPGELIGQLAWDIAPEFRDPAIFPHYETAMVSRTPVFFETYYKPACAWLEVRAYPFEDGLSVFFHDVTARRRTQIAIRESEQRLREVIEMTPSGYVLFDPQGTILGVNPALCQISGYAQEELVGRHMSQLFATCPTDGALSNQGAADYVHGKEAVARHKLGHALYVLVNAVIKRDGQGNSLSMTAFLTDITERKQAESRLHQLATHDVLTGLPNRALLNEHLERMLRAAPLHESVAVMFIDLDRFKEINDSMGHEPGDNLLREVGLRLQKNLRPSDIVARMGGDEFVVAAHCAHGVESAERIVEKLYDALAAPVQLNGQEVYVGASIGISMYPRDGTSREALFQNADTAMYRAKVEGRKTYRFFRQEMSDEAKTRMTLEHALRHALDRNEFELHYQPRIRLKTMSIVGMEALIRWNHPQLGQVSPMQFIPLAEEKGLIDRIGAWVLEQACGQTRRLIDKYSRQLCVSVNLSVRQLRSGSILDQVRNSLRRADLPPHLLELELTESCLIEDIAASANVLKSLKDLGISLSVDDFGTGYSGLAYLRRFPLDTLKLDRSFVTREDEGISSSRFVKAFVDLAHALNLSVVAEGVESNETLQLLRDAGCDEAQGYLLARPLSLNAFEDYLSRLPAAEGKRRA